MEKHSSHSGSEGSALLGVGALIVGIAGAGLLNEANKSFAPEVCHPVARTLEAQLKAAETGEDFGNPVEAGEVSKCVSKYPGETQILEGLCAELRARCNSAVCFEEAGACLDACDGKQEQ